MTTFDPSEWIVRLTEPRVNHGTILCFAHAGGGVNIWRPWAELMPPTIGLSAVLLPGREARFAETPVSDLHAAARAVADAVMALSHPPEMFLGHSLGALVAYETVRTLESRKLPCPALLAVTGMRAPDLPPRRPPIHDAPEPDLIERLTLTGGIPKQILDAPSVLSLFVPLLRADYRLHDTYRWVKGAPLRCGVAAFAGTQDPLAPPEDVAAWRNHTNGAFTFETFEGGHFFPHARPAAVIEHLLRLLPQRTESHHPGVTGDGYPLGAEG